nr:uncharacterized protein LOC117273735 [Nicotiana tomentosiformis]
MAMNLAAKTFTYMHQPPSLILHNFPSFLKSFLLLINFSLNPFKQKSFSFIQMAFSSKNVSSSKGKNKAEDASPPTVDSIIPRSLVTTKDFEEKFPSVLPRTWAVGIYPSYIYSSSIPVVKEDCRCHDLDIVALDLSERVTLPKDGFIYFYTYPFTLGAFSLSGEFDSVIAEFCLPYQVCLAQVSPSVWRTIACLWRLCQETGDELSLAHVINLCSPKILRGGMINFNKPGHDALLSSMDDDNDRGWMERFIAVATNDIIPATVSSYLKAWNRTPTRWFPPMVEGLD